MKFDKHGCKTEKIKIKRPDGSAMNLLIVSPEQWPDGGKAGTETILAGVSLCGGTLFYKAGGIYMMIRKDTLEELLSKECYLIDLLPQTVPADSRGQYFDVEEYFLTKENLLPLKGRFVNAVLKMMCYYPISVSWNDEKNQLDRPKPAQIESIFSEIIEKHNGPANILFPEENTLLVYDWDNLCLAVYNPNEEMQSLFEQAALSEGLFWRRAN